MQRKHVDVAVSERGVGAQGGGGEANEARPAPKLDDTPASHRSNVPVPVRMLGEPGGKYKGRIPRLTARAPRPVVALELVQSQRSASHGASPFFDPLRQR